MDKILLIDDDKSLGTLLKQYLSQFGFELDHAILPSQGFEMIGKGSYKAIILDVMLPEMDGFQVFERLRLQTKIPVIMLTARGELSDKVLGLEMGIDDYLSKPFEPRELVARLKAIIRRAQKNPSSHGRFQSFELIVDTNSHQAFMNNVDLHLSSYEYALLKIFIENPQIVMSRDHLLDKLKGLEWEAENRSVDVAISRLRQKLKDSAKSPKYLKTAWGDGYIYIAPVEELK